MKKIDINKRMVDAVGENALKTWSNEKLLLEFIDVLKPEEITDKDVIFEDNNARNGLLITFAIMMMLKEGIKPADAFKRVRSEKLGDAYGFHASIISFLDSQNFDYDDDEILDLCLKNLK